MTESEWLVSEDPQLMLTMLNATLGPPNSSIWHPASDRKLRLFACGCVRLVWDGVKCDHCHGTGRVYDYRTNHAPGDTDCWICHGTGRSGGLTDPRSRRAVEVAERYADGEATEAELREARFPEDFTICQENACEAANLVMGDVKWHHNRAAQAALLREVFGNPFGRKTGCEACRGAGRFTDGRGEGTSPTHGQIIPCPWCVGPWLTPTVLSLAQAAYQERGHWESCTACSGEGCSGNIGYLDDPRERCDGSGRRWRETGLLDPDRLAVLADALEEAGCTDMVGCNCPECAATHLLNHLRFGGPHVRGCWALDLILGKEWI